MNGPAKTGKNTGARSHVATHYTLGACANCRQQTRTTKHQTPNTKQRQAKAGAPTIQLHTDPDVDGIKVLPLLANALGRTKVWVQLCVVWLHHHLPLQLQLLELSIFSDANNDGDARHTGWATRLTGTAAPPSYRGKYQRQHADITHKKKETTTQCRAISH